MKYGNIAKSIAFASFGFMQRSPRPALSVLIMVSAVLEVERDTDYELHR